MSFIGWLVTLSGAYVAFKYRHKLKESKEAIAGVVAVLVFGILMVGVGSIGSHTTTQARSSSKVVKHHHSKKERTSSSSSSEEEEVASDSSSDDAESETSSAESTTDEAAPSSSNTAESEASSDSSSESSSAAPTNNGDMLTNQQGTIVGNSQTMIYHTPDQKGYRMNSANAVYFKSEADAQAAGYRKSLR